MSSDVRPFQALKGQTTRVSNAVAASDAIVLPKTSDAVVLTNRSASAWTFYAVTSYLDEGDIPDGDEPTVPAGDPGDTPIPPLAQIRVYTDFGPKVIRLISDAADSYTSVTPGTGV